MPPQLDFYNIATQALLLTMSGYSPIERRSVLDQIRKATERMGLLLSQVSGGQFLELRDMVRIGVYKSKYLPYSVFLATISSYPLLKRAATEGDLANAILAKVAGILSIKVLDNINDDLHTIQQAADSLEYQKRAFLERSFSYRREGDVIARAENCTYLMARWSREILSEIEGHCPLSYELFKRDMRTYMLGQRESFYQKMNAENRRTPRDLGEYLHETCEKGVGNIWFDIDLCHYEKNNGGLSDQELKIASKIRKAMELAHKSALLYDDVSDLRDDLIRKIVNCVIFYALDNGLLTQDEIWNGIDTTMLKLERSGALRDVIHLGDLMFLRSIRYLDAIRKADAKLMDIDGISFAVRVLRAFSMRKWVYREKSLTSFGAMARSFYSQDRLRKSIPERLLGYEKVMESFL